MRIVKRYTNQTFTKRVDHEGGARREPRATAGSVVCSKCGSVFQNRRWTASEKINADTRLHDAKLGICPACQQIASGVAGGFVHIDGSFLKGHETEILNLLRNEEQRAIEDNPLSRIIKWDKDDEGELQIKTTTEHLAQRLGHALEKAFDGKVKYDFSHENKVARVSWQRD
jgi:NMD protein affecting ribosome stability and mRNA decay